LTADSRHLGFLVADIARLMRRAFRQRQRRTTLTLAQARTLVHLSRQDGVRQVVLAESLEVQPITLARVIDQLALAGLVERRTDPTDRRAYRVYLKRAAQPHLDAIEAVAQSIREDALRGFDSRSSAQVLDALALIHANLSTIGHDVSNKKATRVSGTSTKHAETRSGRGMKRHVSSPSSPRRVRSSDPP
jgi:DNA-binding MarR family transcriptional regulator